MKANNSSTSPLAKTPERNSTAKDFWEEFSIIQIISDLKESSMISNFQAAQTIKLVKEKKSFFNKITKRELCKEKLRQFLLSYIEENIKDITPILMTQKLLPSYQFLENLCKKANSEQLNSFAKLCLKFVRRVILNVIQNKSGSRTLNEKNYSAKKYIFDVPDVLSFVRSLGFKNEVGKKVSCLVISEENAKVLSGIKILEEIDSVLSSLTKTTPPKTKETIPKVSPNKTKTNQKSQDGFKEERRIYCKSHCGFYGSKNLNGYCSKCFEEKRYLKAPLSPRGKLVRVLRRLTLLRWWLCSVKTEQIDRSRCWRCKRKIGIFSFRCECRFFFCTKHRSPLDHDCNFDYKKRFEKRIIKENPLLAPKKVDDM